MSYQILVSGVVQGVGFRPFVYRTAKKHELRGYVRNAGNGVEIGVDGEEAKIKKFVYELKNGSPPLAEVYAIHITQTNETFEDFTILKSEREGGSDSVIPPDVAVCDTCVSEIFSRGNRRYLYPFTVCTDCGPRFSIIEALPYDRANTTMREFAMCGDCSREYLNVFDRRFRAEPICCTECGPKFELFRGYEKVESGDAIRSAAQAIDSGAIVAIKGVGGTHLATSATSDEAVLKIRKMLRRPQKPFALMARSIEVIERFAFISDEEKRLLQCFRKPILLLEKRGDANISPHIAPRLHNIGVMLPYAGVHYLLFHHSQEPAFVMTSANMPGEPMTLEKEEILSLGADFSLIHNRKIRNRCDDSVVKFVAGNATFLRRSRGYVPQPVELKISCNCNILSLGAELDVAACVLKGKRAFLSQYVGNTTKLKTLEYLEHAVYSLVELTLSGELKAVAVDLHPSFNTSRLGAELASKFGCKLIKVQHHHAHLASLLAERGLKKIIGAALDGTGYGSDGTAWGGEIMLAGFESFERLGSLEPQPMPGGDLAARHPARMAAGILSKKYSSSELKEILIKNLSNGFKNGEIDVVIKQIERRYNTPLTTSAGRVLDALAALLGVCYERTYEGEPAMKLEALAAKGRSIVDIPVIIEKKNGRWILNTTEILDAALQAKQKHAHEDIAFSAQTALANGIAEILIVAAIERGVKDVGISGGVAYNDAIVRNIKAKVEGAELKFYAHRAVPCGDGGISLGQAAIAAWLTQLE